MAQRVTISAVGSMGLSVTIPDEMERASDLTNRMVEYWRKQIEPVARQEPDLIVLPELCDVPVELICGQGREKYLEAYLDTSREPVLALMRETAKRCRSYVAYPTLVVDDEVLRNSVVLIDRDGGIVGRYDKFRPTLSEIDEGIVGGTGPVVLECDFGRVGFVICFDLNFEELRQAYARLRPDLMVFASMFHGGLMQAGWAHACRSHWVSAIDQVNLPSEIYTPTGELLAASTNYFNHIAASVNLDCALVHLDCLFDKLDAMREQYGTRLRIHDPGRLGAVLLSAESDDLSMQDVIEAYDLELLDAYLERSRQRRCEH